MSEAYSYDSLPKAEAVVIRSWVSEFNQPDLIMEASHDTTQGLVLPSQFEVGVRHEVGLTLYFHSEEMRCVELTGFRVPIGEAVFFDR
jgi:hypothetical protein